MPDIRIRISTGTKTAGTGAEPQENKGVASDGLMKNAVVSVFAHQMLASGKQALSTSISIMGTETGNYALQEQIERVSGLITSAVGTGVAFATNPVLGVAKLTGDILSIGMKAYSELSKLKLEEKNAEIMRRRSGNSLTNKSRTGD